MQFIHFTILPSIIFIFSIILQSWFVKKEFSQYFKLYFLGIIAGIIISFFLSFFNSIFLRSSHYITILLKSLLIEGLLTSTLIAITLYYIFLFLKINKNHHTWSLLSIFSFSYIGGVYTVINILKSSNKDFPNTIFEYIISISLLAIISIALGLGSTNFFNSIGKHKKILWAGFSISAPTIAIFAYNFLKFYDYKYRFLLLIPIITGFTLFEMYDFKVFRKR